MPRRPQQSSRPWIEFRGEVYYQDTDRYFKTSRTRGNRLLHRDVWEDAHGPIPEGWVVHHRDHDRGNNDLSNLEACSWGDHMRHHPRVVPPAARVAGTHRYWAAKPPRQSICTICGRSYEYRSQRESFFCSARCRDRRPRPGH